MKKQIKKLNLSKKTISNLQPTEMNKALCGVGQGYTAGCHGHTFNGNCTANCGGGPTNGHTCAYTCL